MAASPKTQDQYEALRNIELSPRAKIAATLVGAGASHEEASAATGLHKAYLSQLRVHNPRYQQIMAETTVGILDKIQDPTELLRSLLLPSVRKLGHLMEHGEKEDTQLKAANSILDRGGMSRETKIASATLTLTGKDVEGLTRAIVESARIREQFADHANGYQAIEAVVERPSGREPTANPTPVAVLGRGKGDDSLPTGAGDVEGHGDVGSDS